VLGQPRGVSIPKQIRDDMVTGVVDPELIARRMQVEREAELCSCCGLRPIRMNKTGLCVVCHLDLIAERYREQIDELVKVRLVNRLKQQKKRLKDGHELQAEEWLG